MSTCFPQAALRHILLLVPLSILIPLGANSAACPGGPMAPASITTMNLTMDLGSEPRSMPALEKVLPILMAPSDEPESPWNNALSLVRGSEVERKAKASEILLAHLNRSETSLVLLDAKDEGRGFQPERGESMVDNWIFSLVVPSLSDHIYWVVIPKKPQTATLGYVYGFN